MTTKLGPFVLFHLLSCHTYVPMAAKFHHMKENVSGGDLPGSSREGELEKRSDNLLQFCEEEDVRPTTDSLNIYADTQKRTKGVSSSCSPSRRWTGCDAPASSSITIVTTDNKEIDCARGGELLERRIIMALIDYQKYAIPGLKTRQDNESLGSRRGAWRGRPELLRDSAT
ncbi:pleckstrin homology-like domain family A member 2 [Lates japonicus]|uniref:Pleckstrin homology-like domain family A member 2 n=1 Tax=Lates japonicus TaxID=270547 RepID=A0AAD3MRP4_LATJO|nr:pleckstrin homology-like domain family A member 2 [Lates japonicus]